MVRPRQDGDVPFFILSRPRRDVLFSRPRLFRDNQIFKLSKTIREASYYGQAYSTVNEYIYGSNQRKQTEVVHWETRNSQVRLSNFKYV